MERPFPAYKGDDPYIFVSYLHEDASAVFPELTWLKHLGFNIWFDEGIEAGTEWREEIGRAIKHASLFLYFVSPESVQSGNCHKEVSLADKEHIPIVAIHLKNTDLPDGLDLTLSDRQALLKYELPYQEYQQKLESRISSYLDQPIIQAVVEERKKTVPIMASVIGLVVLATGLFFYNQQDVQQTIDATTDHPMDEPDATINAPKPIPGFSGRAAIAVLPFVNMSDDPQQEYFADGLTEDLITGLQSFRSFPIIARTSTFKYKDKPEDVRDIAAALGAGYIIEGSVRKVDEDVRINVQLINHQGRHVWAESYDRKFQDVLRIQAELVGKIMLAIEPELIISEADRVRFVRTEDMEAFDYFLRAAANTYAPFAFTDLNGRVVSPERLELARGYATKAVELDPSFAAGWRMLNHIDGSYVVNFAYLFSQEEQKAIIKRAIEYGQRSRQLSPFEPTVCSCLAAMLLMNGDVDDARLLQEESLKQNPANALVHAVMAKILQVSGENQRALDEIALAKRLSPEDMAMTTFLYFEAAIYQDLGDFDKAVVAAKKSLLLSPINYDSEYVKIASLFASGERLLAQTALTKLRVRTPEDFKPSSGWAQPFPQSVADNVTLANGVSLQELNYNEGLRLMFEDLGWAE